MYLDLTTFPDFFVKKLTVFCEVRQIKGVHVTSPCRQFLHILTLSYMRRQHVASTLYYAEVWSCQLTYLYKKEMLFLGLLLVQEFDMLVLKFH